LPVKQLIIVFENFKIKAKKRSEALSDLMAGLNGNFFFNNLFTAVVATFRTNIAEFYCGPTVGTSSQRRENSLIVGSAFIPSGFRMFMLRMRHYNLILIIVQQFL